MLTAISTLLGDPTLLLCIADDHPHLASPPCPHHPPPSLRSGKLSAAQRELAEAEQRLGEKAERLRASLKQEMSAAQQQVGGLAGVWSNSAASAAWAARCSLLTGRLRYGSLAGVVELCLTAMTESFR